jgi:hypothetical protein
MPSAIRAWRTPDRWLAGLAAIATLGWACARGSSAPGAVGPVSDPGIPSVSLSEITAGQWQVVIRTLQPTTALRFDRNPDDSRARRWQVERGFELVHEDGIDWLRRKDHAAFQTVSLTVPARYVPLPKEYAPFSPYSDGGTLIYSGQFHVNDATSASPRADRWQFTVTAPPGAHLVVEGGLHESGYTFTDAGNGTNIYVGGTQPLASSHFVAVIDRGLAPEVIASLYRLLPLMMDFFTSRLGPLPSKPMLFASLDPDPPKNSGFGMQGGGLPSQIFFHLYGEKWAEAAAEQVVDVLPWMFAHEAGHLFQSVDSIAGSYPKEQSWIHEGGAEAFAALTVVEFGGLSREHVEKRIEGAIAECAAGLEALGSKPLNASAEAGAFGNYYRCGLVMQLAIDAETKRTSRGARDLFDVWARFLSRVRSGEPFNQDMFLDTASELGAVRAASFARSLATIPQDAPLHFLRTGLNEAR